MTAVPLYFNAIDVGGGPASGALLNVYTRGTATRRPMWSDVGMATPLTNPIVADADGRFEGIYFDSTVQYSILATTADGATTILEADIVGGVLFVSSSSTLIVDPSWLPLLSQSIGGIEMQNEDLVSSLQINRNPDGLTWESFYGKHNYNGIYWDIGGYGDIAFGDVIGEVIAIAGATRVPSNAQTGGKGLSGYARTSSPDGPAIGIFAYGKSDAANALAWAYNSVTEAGDHATTVWGNETDLNVVNVNTVVLGIDVTGGSSVEPNLAIGYRLAAINAFTTPRKKWTVGYATTDEAAYTAFEVGTASMLASSASQPVDFYARDVSNNRYKGGQALHDGVAMTLRTSQSSGLVKLQSRSAGGVLQDNVVAWQSNTGIGYSVGLPLYTAHVGGDVVSLPSASVTPTNNGEMVVQKTSNSRVTRKVKGSDGTVRSRNEGMSSAGVFGPSVQVFTASGTYTPTEGIVSIIVEVRGGGGGGGGVGNAAGYFAGGGGAEGGYARKRILASSLGATETVTVGAAGTAGANTGGDGGTGGTTSFGAHCSATGGNGGSGTTTAGSIGAGRAGGAGASGDVNLNGAPGQYAVAVTAQSIAASGAGGGQGGGNGRGSNNAGTAGENGGGGGGAVTNNGSTGNLGGVGGAGYVIVTEFYA